MWIVDAAQSRICGREQRNSDVLQGLLVWIERQPKARVHLADPVMRAFDLQFWHCFFSFIWSFAITSDHKRCDQEHSWLKISSPPSPSTDGVAGQGNPLFISVFALLQGIRQRSAPSTTRHWWFPFSIRQSAMQSQNVIRLLHGLYMWEKWKNGRKAK